LAQVSTGKTVMHLQDNNYQVRKEAIETLSRISARGDRTVVIPPNRPPYTLNPKP